MRVAREEAVKRYPDEYVHELRDINKSRYYKPRISGYPRFLYNQIDRRVEFKFQKEIKTPHNNVKNNSRDGSKFRGCSPHQISGNLTGIILFSSCDPYIGHFIVVDNKTDSTLVFSIHIDGDSSEFKENQNHFNFDQLEINDSLDSKIGFKICPNSSKTIYEYEGFGDIPCIDFCTFERIELTMENPSITIRKDINNEDNWIKEIDDQIIMYGGTVNCVFTIQVKDLE